MIGHRNIQARERRRQKLKDCIPAPPSDYQMPKLTLKENFGWRVLEKTHVESFFPPLTQHFEKPDTSGNFEKVTYVLHMGGPATVVERTRRPVKRVEEEIAKEQPQPAPPRLVSPKPSYVTWASTSSLEGHQMKSLSQLSNDSKPTKLISGFYYTKRKDRSRSRSVNKSKDRSSKHKHRHNSPGDEHLMESAKDTLLRHLREEKYTMGGDYDKMTEIVDEHKEATRAAFKRVERRDYDEDMTRKKLREKESQRSVSKKTGSGWNLRAGASQMKSTKTTAKTKGERERGVKTKEEEELSQDLTITAVNVGRGEPTGELLKTHSGTNKYLYVPKKRASRTVKTSKQL